nr:probable aminotransferase TAT2 [Tanacetum cinerariifolium]
MTHILKKRRTSEKANQDHSNVVNPPRNVEIRHFDLLPENGWEVDIVAVDALDDQNTVSTAIINLGNPCGNIYS